MHGGGFKVRLRPTGGSERLAGAPLSLTYIFYLGGAGWGRGGGEEGRSGPFHAGRPVVRAEKLSNFPFLIFKNVHI